CARVSGLMDYW
nr:immunoglobulin heavy chain junction region [Mus musculus]MBK4189084.1 immunoglobulin heavy chain junction region [Mus musculus]